MDASKELTPEFLAEKIADDRRAQDAQAAAKRENVAKAILWRMNSIMHDHEDEWRKSLQQNVYRDCAEAALSVK